MPRPPVCVRCGQTIDRTKDSFRQAAGGRIEHVTCPTSPQLKALPAVDPSPTTPAADRPQYLTLADAAKMLSVSAQTIRRRIHAGELPAKRLKGTAGGGRETILVDHRDLLALLEDYRGPAADETEDAV